jgi:hypothetical protein
MRQQARATHTFSDHCEQFLFSLGTNRPLAESEAEIIAYYCKEILAKVQPLLPCSSSTMTAMSR